ncbi:unnamed protein product [Cylicocyclus nassatus]|uniref:Uncharacterized protein n=1 Tax=Cylicocyclus nassatus TaxID=53992 RepID=A0AA36M4Q3_CYLNA|nr:unnamed protein product [Cylicocyclus nassatus]
MNFLFFFFFLAACYLGLTNASTLSPEEARRFMECMKKCKGDKWTCQRKCSFI